MGYRPHFVKTFEHDRQITGYNFGVSKLCENLEKLGIVYTLDDNDVIRILDEEIIALPALFEDKELQDLRDYLTYALELPYCKKYGRVRIDFF